MSGRPPSLESLVESGDLSLEVLHPGGLDITAELAELCGIGSDSVVLDIASGTGESACYLAERFAAEVFGVDLSHRMVARAAQKARERRLKLGFLRADAHHLPFRNGSFDAAISECTLSLLRKETAIGEMIRVVKSGGRVGIHEICWKEDAPEELKRELEEIEGERPETLRKWKGLLEVGGLDDVHVVDRSGLLARWFRDSKKRLGQGGATAACSSPSPAAPGSRSRASRHRSSRTGECAGRRPPA
ncbi:MAG: class I SAM-dependent methyltransferase [Gemmatimonadota bacterium]